MNKAYIFLKGQILQYSWEGSVISIIQFLILEHKIAEQVKLHEINSYPTPENDH